MASDYEYALVMRGFWAEHRWRGMATQTKFGKGYEELALLLNKTTNVYITQRAYSALLRSGDLVWKHLHRA